MRTLPVHWHEGMFLRPHHFQAADRYWADQVRQGSRWDLNYNWGIRRIDIDLPALKNYRFVVNQLQARLKISPKTLSQRLRTLVEAGFLARHAYNEIPPRVEYQPTAKTQELGELFRALDRWSARNTLHPVPVISVVGRVTA